MAGLGSAPGIILGAGIGAAAATALEPAFEVPRQDAWKTAPYRILDVGLIARLVAEGGIPLDGTAYDEAHRQGYSDDKLNALVYLAQTVPGAAEAMHLWRLGVIGDDLFKHVLVKEGLDSRYVDPIIKTKIEELIGLGDIAMAVVRGILPAPSYVPVPVPTQGDKVPRFPQVNIDPEELAAKIGFSPEALQVMVGRSGLSMAPVMAAQALFRGIIGPNDYEIAIGEGDLRTEWAEPVKEASRQIPSTHTFVQGHLRGWISQQEMLDGAARHGQKPADTQLEYEVGRRPLNIHAITTGLARGGTFDTSNAPFNDPYEAAVHEADLGPEWYDLAKANKYLYPSAFVLRSLAQAGDLGGEAAVEQVLLEIGWKPSFAKQVANAWTQGSATGDKHVAKAQTALWTTTHKSYVAREITDADATTALSAAGVSAAAVPAVLNLWQTERDLVRKQLSPAQVRKAVSGGVTNPATGQPWSHADGITALLARGYDQADAETFLSE